MPRIAKPYQRTGYVCTCPNREKPKPRNCAHSWWYNRPDGKGGSKPIRVDTMPEAAEAIAKLYAGVSVAQPISRTLRLFRNLAADWLVCDEARKGSSADTYEIIVRVHLLPYWGSHGTHAITKQEVQGWVRQMEQNEGIGNGYAEQIWKVFRMIMKHAVSVGARSESPCYKVSGPVVPDSVHYVFSPDEFWALHAEMPPLYRDVPLVSQGLIKFLRCPGYW